jgi:hypothetical protein
VSNAQTLVRARTTFFLLSLLFALLALGRLARPALADEPPSGPFIEPPVAEARPASPRQACSFRVPVCVHADAAWRGATLAVLAAEERAWEGLTGALDLPAPDPDPETRAYDVYLVDRVPSGLDALTTSSLRDVRSRVDRASAFTRIDRRLTGCALETAIARELARAALFRAAPATDLGSARAEAAYLARLLVPCALGAPGGLADFQAHPERPIVDTWAERDPRAGAVYDDGAALFFWWLDASFGAQPAAIVRALWALSPTRTPLGAARWVDEPDGFDVLRVTFKGALATNSTLDDLLLDFGVARAFMGDEDDGSVLPDAQPLGAALRPRIDWEIDWPAAPRRVAASVFPTGAAYVVVHHAGAPPGARLRLEATWEEHAKMRWAVVKRDAHGRRIRQVLVPTTEKATEAQVTVVDLDAAFDVLVVGVNTGDPEYTFDPDDETWEPHGWLLTIASE